MPITVVFGTRKILVPSKSFHFTHQKLQYGVDLRPHSLLDLSFSKRIHANDSVTGTVTAGRYRNMLDNFVIPQIQQRQSLDSFTFMQDGVLKHIRLCVLQFLQQHFTNDRVISNAFPTI